MLPLHHLSVAGSDERSPFLYAAFRFRNSSLGDDFSSIIRSSHLQPMIYKTFFGRGPLLLGVRFPSAVFPFVGTPSTSAPPGAPPFACASGSTLFFFFCGGNLFSFRRRHLSRFLKFSLPFFCRNSRHCSRLRSIFFPSLSSPPKKTSFFFPLGLRSTTKPRPSQQPAPIGPTCTHSFTKIFLLEKSPSL